VTNTQVYAPDPDRRGVLRRTRRADAPPPPTDKVDDAALASRLVRALDAQVLVLHDEASGSAARIVPPGGVTLGFTPEEVHAIISALRRREPFWTRLLRGFRDLAATTAFVAFIGVAGALLGAAA
jgi:hypothetical protein